jgi:hypothetical protein
VGLLKKSIVTVRATALPSKEPVTVVVVPLVMAVVMTGVLRASLSELAVTPSLPTSMPRPPLP